ncbi:MAG: hypothetical protein HY695_05725 [Deltaproteobacteria bacterium]|nr:hypothetical protein [Deltaproteobacteria bacterium]
MRFKRFSDRLGELLSKDRKTHWLVVVAIFLTIVFPVVLVAAFSYVKTYRDLTDFTLSRRQAIAYLAAATIRGNLDRLTDIGVSLATRVHFRELLSQGRWQEAAEILRSVPRDFPFIDRVFITDALGTLTADVPELPGVRGKNFAYRDWYQGVSRRWEPYVSEIYQRAAEPRLNVVAVAVPVEGKDKKIAGVMVLQVRTDSLLEWTKYIDVGPLGIIFAVDGKGKIVGHPEFEASLQTVDYSRVPAVQRLLRGEKGVEVLFSPLEKEKSVVAYEPVPGYAWGAVVHQPAATAFASRNSSLNRLMVAYVLIGLFSCSLAHLIVRFIAARRKAEEDIRKLIEDLKQRSGELEEANKELQAFSYSVSHDLRAPVRHMHGYAELLKETALSSLNEKGRHYLDTILDSAKEMTNLIDELLAFSRMGQAEIKKSRVVLDQILQKAMKNLSADMDGRKIIWKIDSLPEVYGDPFMLRLVLLNYLSNALKFTRTRSEARIEIGAMNGEKHEAIVFVRDNGVGFDMRYVDKLFGIFQRLHRAGEFEGTGIGLANVRRIIARHGGRTWAEGSLDGGATFYFSLPQSQKGDQS